MTRFISALIVILTISTSCHQESASKLKIIGGKPSSEHHPWFAQLMSDASSTKGFCGGTLVAPRVVITAAHCVDAEYVRTLHVGLGMVDGENLHLNKPVKVEGILAHRDYDPETSKNDIAILYLADYQGVEFERPVAPLTFSRDTSSPEAEGRPVMVVGLGNATSVGDIFDGVIREVELPVLATAKCDEKYDNVDGTQICAGNWDSGGIDSCQGDSGGPMVSKDPAGSGVLVGVASYGEGCAQKGAPGVYTRVASFAGWIDQAVETLKGHNSGQQSAGSMETLLTTRCVSQFGYLPVENRAGEDNVRDTTYGMNLKDFKLIDSDSPGLPVGTELDKCQFEDHGHAVDARWIRMSGSTGTPDSKVAVIATVTSPDGSAAKTWVSRPQRLVYLQDTLSCQSSMGQVILADQRKFTYVVYKDVFYALGEPAADPADNQTTWGCSIGDASIEVYEVGDGVTKELAARIHHRSIGTVSVKLDRIDRESDLTAGIDWESSTSGRLKIENKSTGDLFTWKLVCPVKYTMTLADGASISAVQESSGAGFSVLMDAALVREGTVRSGAAVDVGIKLDSPVRLSGSACVINGAIVVESTGQVAIH